MIKALTYEQFIKKHAEKFPLNIGTKSGKSPEELGYDDFGDYYNALIKETMQYTRYLMELDNCFIFAKEEENEYGRN